MATLTIATLTLLTILTVYLPRLYLCTQVLTHALQKTVDFEEELHRRHLTLNP